MGSIHTPAKRVFADFLTLGQNSVDPLRRVRTRTAGRGGDQDIADAANTTRPLTIAAGNSGPKFICAFTLGYLGAAIRVLLKVVKGARRGACAPGSNLHCQPHTRIVEADRFAASQPLTSVSQILIWLACGTEGSDSSFRFAAMSVALPRMASSAESVSLRAALRRPALRRHSALPPRPNL